MQHSTIINMLAKDSISCSYNEDNKNSFKKSGMYLMKQLAPLVGGTKADVRYNAGGIAVSGEVTLHTECIYVQLSIGFRSSMGFLVRTCKGKKDYSGGQNHWYKWEMLNDLNNLAKCINNLIENQKLKDIITLKSGCSNIEVIFC